MIRIPVLLIIIFTILLYIIAIRMKLEGLPSIYVFILAGLFTVALVIDYIRKEIKYRQFCKEFWG